MKGRENAVEMPNVSSALSSVHICEHIVHIVKSTSSHTASYRYSPYMQATITNDF